MPPRNIIATSGDMVYVNGSAIAIALTKEMPGSAPAITPMNTPSTMTPRCSGCTATASPCTKALSASMPLVDAEQAVQRDGGLLEHALAAIERHQRKLDEEVQHAGRAEQCGKADQERLAQATDQQPAGDEDRRRKGESDERNRRAVRDEQRERAERASLVVVDFARGSLRLARAEHLDDLDEPHQCEQRRGRCRQEEHG